MINDLCAKFPHCNIPVDVVLQQKVRIIVSKSKDLEETIEKMDAEHKPRIAELKVKTRGTPPTEKEAWMQALKDYAGTAEVRIEKAQKLINDASKAWTNMEDIEGLVQVLEKLQATQHEVDALIGTMKDLQPIQRMLKMGEATKLQAKMQKLREEEECYTKTL